VAGGPFKERGKDGAPLRSRTRFDYGVQFCNNSTWRLDGGVSRFRQARNRDVTIRIDFHDSESTRRSTSGRRLQISVDSSSGSMGHGARVRKINVRTFLFALKRASSSMAEPRPTYWARPAYGDLHLGNWPFPRRTTSTASSKSRGFRVNGWTMADRGIASERAISFVRKRQG